MILDPDLEKILPLAFIKSELLKFPRIRAVRLRSFYDRKKIWGCYLDLDEEIWLDPATPREFICQYVNAKHEGFGLQCSEAWVYGFAHEVKHSQSRENEWEADQYAKSVILQRRTEFEKFYDTVRNAAGEAMRQAIHAAFRGDVV